MNHSNSSYNLFIHLKHVITSTVENLSPPPPFIYPGDCKLCNYPLQKPPLYVEAFTNDLEETFEPITQLPCCGHCFHERCFMISEHTKCPACKKKFMVVRISQATDCWVYQCPPHFVKWLSYWSIVLERQKKIPRMSPWRLTTKLKRVKCVFHQPVEEETSYLRRD